MWIEWELKKSASKLLVRKKKTRTESVAWSRDGLPEWDTAMGEKKKTNQTKQTVNKIRIFQSCIIFIAAHFFRVCVSIEHSSLSVLLLLLLFRSFVFFLCWCLFYVFILNFVVRSFDFQLAFDRYIVDSHFVLSVIPFVLLLLLLLFRFFFIYICLAMDSFAVCASISPLALYFAVCVSFLMWVLYGNDSMHATVFSSINSLPMLMTINSVKEREIER